MYDSGITESLLGVGADLRLGAPACVGTSPWFRGEHSPGEWPIPTQLLV